MSSVSRRELLIGGSALALAPKMALAQGRRRRVLRIGHLTDIHVQPERGAPEGMEAALDFAIKQKPDLLMISGDCVMDVMGATQARGKAQWDIYQRIMAGVKLPVHQAIGNHDVWGWNKSGSATTGNEALWGKKWPLEVFEREKEYYSFDQAGWHIVVLDSTFPSGTGYTAKLDDAQFEWLSGDLAGTKLPTLIVSHQPIMSASAYVDGDNEKSGNWVVPGAWMHIDFRRIKDLFRKHPHVKACISGHIHLCDRVDYLGVSYFCNGAASGGWWGGNYQEFPPMIATVDLFSDGTVENTMHDIGWKARP